MLKMHFGEMVFDTIIQRNVRLSEATGFGKSIIKYDANWNADERIKLLQQIDKLASEEYHWAFGWGAPYGYRCLNWDKFGMPDHGIGYSGNWLSPISYWWIDPEKKKRLQEARKNSNITINIENEIVDYWSNLKK